MTNPISAPAGFVPQMAVSFSAAGNALPVDADNPLPTGERAFQGMVAIVPGTDQAPARGVAITCTVAGNAVFKLADGSQLTVPVDTGLAILPLAVRTVVVAGTTATATYANLL
jgi:hypothetical protein